MTSAAKILVAMRRNPRDWQISHLQTVARHFGIDWRHQGGSHCIFIRKDGHTCRFPHVARLNQST
jgi:ribosomal protein L24E